MTRLYDFKCESCGLVFERLFVAVDSIPEYLTCPECGIGTAYRCLPIVRCNMGPAGAYGYYDDNLECYIHSNQHRREVMQQKGVTDWYDSPKSENLPDKHLAKGEA